MTDDATMARRQECASTYVTTVNMSDRLITAIIAVALGAGVLLALAIVGYIAKVVIGLAVADERIAAGLFATLAIGALLIVMEGKGNAQ